MDNKLTYEEILHLENNLLLCATNDADSYNRHGLSRLGMTYLLVDHFKAGYSELKYAKKVDGETMPTLDKKLIRSVLNDIYTHYKEEIIDAALNQLTYKEL